MAKTNPTNSQKTAVTTASIKVVDQNPDRSQLILTQTTGVTMWLSVSYDGTVAAEVGKGIPLFSATPFNLAEYAETMGDEWTQGQVNAIAESGSGHVIAIFEAVHN